MNGFGGTYALARALTILESSLPQYLSNTRPWTRREDEPAKQLVEQIIHQQRRDIDRITEMLESARQPLPPAHYPMSFTDTHDLSIEHLILELIHYEGLDVAALELCVALAGPDVVAKSLIEEVLGAARAHLESLQEIAATPAAS